MYISLARRSSFSVIFRKNRCCSHIGHVADVSSRGSQVPAPFGSSTADRHSEFGDHCPPPTLASPRRASVGCSYCSTFPQFPSTTFGSCTPYPNTLHFPMISNNLQKRNTVTIERERGCPWAFSLLCWAPAEPFDPSSFLTTPGYKGRGLFPTPYQIAESFSLQILGQSLEIQVLFLEPDWSSSESGPLIPPLFKDSKPGRLPLSGISLGFGGQEGDSFNLSLFLSAACHFLTSKGCIIYYLEKFYQRESALRNVTVSNQNAHKIKTYIARARQWSGSISSAFWEEKNIVAVILQKRVDIEWYFIISSHSSDTKNEKIGISPFPQQSIRKEALQQYQSSPDIPSAAPATF